MIGPAAAPFKNPEFTAFADKRPMTAQMTHLPVLAGLASATASPYNSVEAA